MRENSADVVLIPGAAGSSAIGAIKSLRLGSFSGKIMSTDGDPLSAGFYLSDIYRISHTITDSQAYIKVREAIAAEKVNIILPTSASETPVYAAKKGELANDGLTFAGCDDYVVNLCDDKLAFHQTVRSHFLVPRTISLRNTCPSEFPCYVKPRTGSGSRGAGLCKDECDWDYISRRNCEMVVQEYLPGREYSVDVLCDLDGTALLAVPRERISILDGVSSRCRVVRHEAIEHACLEMARFLGIKGAACMQLKCGVDEKPRFIEVNARLGGSNIMSTLAGVNFPKLLVDMARGDSISIGDIREITVIRYFEELTIS